MKIMREETFGPVLPIMAFDTDDEAVRLQLNRRGLVQAAADRGRDQTAVAEVGIEVAVRQVTRQGKLRPLISECGVKPDRDNLSVRLKDRAISSSIEIAK